MEKGNLFGYVQCDIQITKNLIATLAILPPVLRNTLVSKNDIGDWMKTYAEEEGILSQPRKQLISSCTLQEGTLISSLHLFYLKLGLLVTKNSVLLITLQRNVSTTCTGSNGRMKER